MARISKTSNPADIRPARRSTAQRVAILGGPGEIPASHAMDATALFNASGRNTGNLAFFHALGAHILAEFIYVGWDFNPDRINEWADCLVIAAANQLNPQWDFGEVATRLERLTVPLCVLGLGAQWYGDRADIRLPEGTVRFAKILGERTAAIGVRGETSGGVLDGIGVKNWEVVGCPSHFINQDEPRLGRRVFASFGAKGAAPEKVIVNFDVGYGVSRAMARIPALVGDAFFSCVWQAPLAAVAMARGDAVADDAEHAAVLDSYASTSDGFRRRAISASVTFFCVDAWLEWCRSYNLSIGTRLHGNIIAMQSGVPAIVLTHDGRTSELAATLKMPAIGISEFESRDWTPEEAFRACAFDANSYDSNRIVLARRYIGLLEEAGLRVSPKLIGLASGG